LGSLGWMRGWSLIYYEQVEQFEKKKSKWFIRLETGKGDLSKREGEKYEKEMKKMVCVKSHEILFQG